MTTTDAATETDNETFEGFAVLELMGHRRLVGFVTEQIVAGHGFLRIDVPSLIEGEPPTATQFYSPTSVYCLTPTTEAMVRRELEARQPRPVARYGLPSPHDDEDLEDEDFPV